MSSAVERETLGNAPTGPELIKRVGAILEEGGLVGMPTETTYGVAARADSPQGLAALQRLKGRPADQPLTWHVAGMQDLGAFTELERLMERLVDRYWPGPLTLVLRGAPPGLQAVTRDGWCGVRSPAHEGTRSILAGLDFPVVMSSANQHGQRPLAEAGEVASLFGEHLALLLDGGPAPLDQASCVLRLGKGHFELLREGLLEIEQLRATAGLRIGFACTGNTCRSPMAEGLARELSARRLGLKDVGLKADEIERFGFAFHSMGVFAGSGSPASLYAVKAVKELGGDISAHRSHAAVPEEISRLDRVYCLTASHFEALAMMLPPGKSRNLEMLDPAGSDIPDPIGGDRDVYRRCAKRILECVEQRLDEWV